MVCCVLNSDIFFKKQRKKTGKKKENHSQASRGETARPALN
tara:strand:- start:7253 stop:7375 length:123 start_codon:yes stop_codon:yes gene_type:complete